jgi:hypothetical protein
MWKISTLFWGTSGICVYSPRCCATRWINHIPPRCLKITYTYCFPDVILFLFWSRENAEIGKLQHRGNHQQVTLKGQRTWLLKLCQSIDIFTMLEEIIACFLSLFSDGKFSSYNTLFRTLWFIEFQGPCSRNVNLPRSDNCIFGIYGSGPLCWYLIRASLDVCDIKSSFFKLHVQSKKTWKLILWHAVSNFMHMFYWISRPL